MEDIVKLRSNIPPNDWRIRLKDEFGNTVLGQVEMTPGGVRFGITAEAAKKIITHVEKDTKHEHGGIVTGLFNELNPNFIVVENFYPVDPMNPSPVQFSMRGEEVESARVDIANTSRPLAHAAVMGTVHSHPGLSTVGPSGADVFFIANLFKNPNQVSLIIDPKSKTIGGYVYDKDQRQVVSIGGISILGEGNTLLDYKFSNSPSYGKPGSLDLPGRGGTNGTIKIVADTDTSKIFDFGGLSSGQRIKLGEYIGPKEQTFLSGLVRELLTRIAGT